MRLSYNEYIDMYNMLPPFIHMSRETFEAINKDFIKYYLHDTHISGLSLGHDQTGGDVIALAVYKASLIIEDCNMAYGYARYGIEVSLLTQRGLICNLK